MLGYSSTGAALTPFKRPLDLLKKQTALFKMTLKRKEHYLNSHYPHFQTAQRTREGQDSAPPAISL